MGPRERSRKTPTRDLRSAGRAEQFPTSTGRTGIGLAILLFALLIAAGGSSFLTGAVSALFEPSMTERSVLSGIVIRPEDVVRDERGRPLLDLPLGPPQPPSRAKVLERQQTLRERHDRTLRHLKDSSLPTRVGPDPPEADAPPAMDSGDPNPDRVVFVGGES